MDVVVLQGYWHWCNHSSEVETLLFCGCFGVLCRGKLEQAVSRQWWLCSVVLYYFLTLEIQKSSMRGRMVLFIFSAVLTVRCSASENRLDDCKVELNQQLLKDVLPFPGLVQEVHPLLRLSDEGGGSRETWDPRHLYFSKAEAEELSVWWFRGFFVISRLLSFWCSGLGCSDHTRGSALSRRPSVCRLLTIPCEADDCCAIFNTSGV